MASQKFGTASVLVPEETGGHGSLSCFLGDSQPCDSSSAGIAAHDIQLSNPGTAHSSRSQLSARPCTTAGNEVLEFIFHEPLAWQLDKRQSHVIFEQGDPS